MWMLKCCKLLLCLIIYLMFLSPVWSYQIWPYEMQIHTNLKSFKIENKNTWLTFWAKFSNFQFKCFVWFQKETLISLWKTFFPVDSLILLTKTACKDHFQIFPINKSKRKWPVEFSVPQDHPFPTQQLWKNTCMLSSF